MTSNCCTQVRFSVSSWAAHVITGEIFIYFLKKWFPCCSLHFRLNPNPRPLAPCPPSGVPFSRYWAFRTELQGLGLEVFTEGMSKNYNIIVLLLLSTLYTVLKHIAWYCLIYPNWQDGMRQINLLTTAKKYIFTYFRVVLPVQCFALHGYQLSEEEQKLHCWIILQPWNMSMKNATVAHKLLSFSSTKHCK